MVVFTITLSGLEIGRFVKQWNREYIVMPKKNLMSTLKIKVIQETILMNIQEY